MGNQRSRKKFWSAAVTRKDEEWHAAAQIERAGFAYYLPQFWDFTIKRGRRVEFRSFLFPRYIFLRVAQGWEQIASFRSIISLICHDEEPVRVPDRELSYLRSREDATGFIRLRPRLRSGDSVEVRHELGVFAGIYQGDLPRARCQVLVSVLGRDAMVAVDDRWLHAA